MHTIKKINQMRMALEYNANPLNDRDAALAKACEILSLTENVVQEVQCMDGMAECMSMVREHLIEAGIVAKTVPPMMLAEGVIMSMQRAVADAKMEQSALIEKLTQERDEALAGIK